MNDTGRQPPPEELTMRIRSVDGTGYRIVNRGPADYVLHPAFLKFLFAAILLYGLQDQDKDLSQLTGWLIWGQVIVVILFWLAFCGGMIRLLVRHNLIRQVWTPILLLPMVILLEANVQLTYFFADLPLKPWSTTLADVTRVAAIVLIFDFLHGHYVVARHPHARVQNSSATEEELPIPLPDAPPPDDQPRTADPAATSDADGVAATIQPPAHPAPSAVSAPRGARAGSARIGSDSFGLADILMIRIEDHYLAITTRSGRSLQRAKLSAIEELHDGDLGIQINRSVWVAFWAIREVRSAKNGQILLVLVNGDEELVAKPRVYAFRQAYRLATGEAT